MKKLHEELNPAMGVAIIDHLQALGTLPDSGYLAGQAVSSALFDLYADDGEGLVIYNDLDVFYQASIADIEEARGANRTLDTVGFQDCRIHQDYAHLQFSVTKSYDIVRSYREDLVNKVAYEHLYCLGFDSPLQTLLKGFDINCTQVGVDLATGQLGWIPAFADFVRSRQLLISNVQTPHHTALRWFKKRHELPGAYGHNEAAMELVSLMSYAKGLDGVQRRIERSNIRWRFGEKNAELYLKFQHELAGYFDLVREDSGFYFLDAKHQPDQVLINQAKRYPTRAIPQMFNELRAYRKAAKTARVTQIYMQNSPGEKGSVGLQLASLYHLSDAYLTGNVDMGKLAEAQSFVRGHPLLVPSFWGLSAESHIEETAAWKALERRYGRWIHGYVELKIMRSRGYENMSAYEWEVYIKEEHLKHIHPEALLIDRTRIELTSGNYHCRELLTRAELFEEGETLHHCVGGYAGEVQDGRSRIFSIRHPNKQLWSTLEAYRYSDEVGSEWFIKQHFSFCNGSPHEDTKQMEDRLVKLLNAPVTMSNQTNAPLAHCTVDMRIPTAAHHTFAHLKYIEQRRIGPMRKLWLTLTTQLLTWTRFSGE
ncbi:PcfJ domain-containing protein [Dickeya sp. NCPPB 3274]|uniref:PcfJ domain-containing protein n=1 Tax=Dickeya sp. NCPPB 3274 TaxID=568766 RepID=UPI0005B35FE5|nr:PcfJ domain-containing protein [Dickeya sp. NCPPB 3274]